MGNIVWYIFVFGILMMIGLVVTEIWPFVIGSMLFVLAYLFFQSYSDKKGQSLSEKRQEEEKIKQEETANRRRLNHEKSRISVMISDFFRIKSIQVRGQNYPTFSAYLETVDPELREFAKDLRKQKIGNQIKDTLIGLKHNGKLVLEDLEFFHAIAENDLGWNETFYPNAKKIIADMNSIGFRLFNPARDAFKTIEQIIENAAPSELTYDEAKARQHQVKVDFLGEGTILNVDIHEVYSLILFFLNQDLTGNKEAKELIRIYKFFSKKNKDIFLIDLLLASNSPQGTDQVSILCSEFNLFRTSNVHYLNIYAAWFKKLGLTNFEMRALKLYMHHFKNHEADISERYERLQSGAIDKYQSYSKLPDFTCMQIDRSKANWDAQEYQAMLQVFESENLQLETPVVVFEEIVSTGDNFSLPRLSEFLIDFHRYGSVVHPTIELTEVVDVNEEGAQPYSAVVVTFDESHGKLSNVGMIITTDTSDLTLNRITIGQFVKNDNISSTEMNDLLIKFAGKKNAAIRNALDELYNSIIEFG